MTKVELVSQIAEQADLTKKTAESVLKSFIQIIHDSLKKSGEIRINALGTFKVIHRKARTGVNPRTGAKIKIAASKAPRFRAAKALREAVAVKEPAKKTEKKKK